MYKWNNIIENPEILNNFKSTSYLSLECDCCGLETKQMVKYLRKHLKDGYTNKFCSPQCSNKFKTKREPNCLHCGKLLKTGQKKYCSSSCSATKNNNIKSLSIKINRPLNVCTNCNKSYKGKPSSKYCSRKCHKKDQNKIKVDDWLSGKDCGYTGKAVALKDFIRNYLFETRGTACSVCHFDDMHPSDGKPITEIDHIDGDAKNNSPDNLRILCPRCHAMTPNFRARNKKSSRVR